MAKIKKIKEGTATVYPATIPQAVIDPTSGKSVRTELNEKEAAANKKQTVTNSATDYPSGAGVTASLALKTDISELNKIYPLYNYNVRVGLDSGLIKDLSHLTDLYRQNLSLLDSTVFLWNGEAGTKRRTSGSNTFASKLYNMANKVQQFGAELVTNGTFTTDTSGWTAGNSATLTIDTNRLKVTNSIEGSYGIAYQTIQTVIGKTYHFSFTGTAGNNTCFVGVSNTVGSPFIYSLDNFTGTKTISFIATSTTTYVRLANYSSVNGSFCFFDNISVKQMDWIDGTNDAVQTTEANQPYVGGLIAPNEVGKIAGTGSHFVRFSDIIFPSNIPFSVTCAIQLGTTTNSFISDAANTSLIVFPNNGLIVFYFDTGNISFTNTALLKASSIGRNAIVTVVYTGTASYCYLDGVFFGSSSTLITNNARFQEFYPAFHTKAIHAQIHNRALSASEIQAQHEYLRLQIPEIEGIAIGNQYWATSNYEGVVAGDGSVIPEVQNSNNVVKLLNSSFATTDNWSFSLTPTWTISGDGQAVKVAGSVNDYISQNTIITAGKWYKVRINISAVSGTLAFTNQSSNYLFEGKTYDSYSGDTTLYLKAQNSATSIRFYGFLSTTVTLLDLEIEEVGWSQSTALYDAIIAQGGTELAALKAAAMWCYYNNDVNNGAIYGKLLNDYAKALIALYPPIGYRVPSEADYNQLIAVLGGSSVVGGKLKKEGFNYWNSPNTGATNESGFSAIAGGRRASDGAFGLIGIQSFFGTSTYDKRLTLTQLSAGATILAEGKERGYSLRLLRNSPVGPNETTVTTGTIVNALGAGNLDIVIPFGYAVDSIKVISKTGITGLSAKYCSRNPATLAVIELDTLFTAKTVVADTPKLFNCNVDQTIQRQDALVRINGTKADTAAEFEVRVNIKKAIL